MSMPSFSNTPLWEKIVGALGVFLITATIGFLLWSAVSQNGAPPDIKIKVNDITFVSGNYLVKVTVQNKGEQTAQDLLLEASLNQDSSKAETIVMKVNYLSPGAAKELGFFFRQDPVSGELTFRPLGFQIP